MKLRNSRLILAFLASFGTAPARSQEGPAIREHRFAGRSRTSSAVLEAHLGLRPGQRYTPEAAAEALERLLAFRFIERASPPEVVPVEGGGRVELLWSIVERPLVRTVRVERKPSGRRPAALPRDPREGLLLRAGEPLIAANLAADREAIRKLYLEEGYLLAEVASEARATAPGQVEAVYTVEEGPRVSIGSIEIEGSREVPARHLRAVLETRPPVFFGLFHRGSFVPARFEKDLERLRAFLRARGYLEARVAADPPHFHSSLTRVDLRILVEEGPRYELAGVRIAGNGPGVPTELLLRQVKARPGRPSDGIALEEDRRRLQRWYEEHYDRSARIELRLDVAFDPADRRVTAVFQIEEEPHRFAGRVEVVGNLRTRDRVVRADLKVVPGAPLGELAVQESESRLARRRFYDPAQTRITVPAAGEVRDVEVRVKEDRAGLLGISGGVGASSGEGEIASVSLVQPNFDLLALPGPRRPWPDAFSGGGQLLELEFAPGTRQSEFFLHFEEPYLYNTRHSLAVLGATRIYERHGYDETRLRGEAVVGRHWDAARRLATRLGYVVEDVRISDVSAVSVPEVSDARGHTLLAYPTLRVSWRDLRPDPYSGPHGFALEALGDASLRATGSEASFLRAQVAADHFQPVSAWINALLPGEPLSEWRGLEHVLRLGAGLGWAEGVEGDALPLFERFFLGGPRSVRGFGYRGIGPAAGNVRLGGEAFLRGTVEYSFPLAIRELRAVALFDFAEVEPRVGRLELSRLRTAAGGGVRIRFRLGRQIMPVDLYWVEALARERGDDERLFGFTLGLGF